MVTSSGGSITSTSGRNLFATRSTGLSSQNTKLSKPKPSTEISNIFLYFSFQFTFRDIKSFLLKSFYYFYLIHLIHRFLHSFEIAKSVPLLIFNIVSENLKKTDQYHHHLFLSYHTHLHNPPPHNVLSQSKIVIFLKANLNY